MITIFSLSTGTLANEKVDGVQFYVNQLNTNQDNYNSMIEKFNTLRIEREHLKMLLCIRADAEKERLQRIQKLKYQMVQTIVDIEDSLAQRTELMANLKKEVQKY